MEKTAKSPFELTRSQDLEHRKCWGRVSAPFSKPSPPRPPFLFRCGIPGRPGRCTRHFRMEPLLQPNSLPLRALLLVPGGWAGASVRPRPFLNTLANSVAALGRVVGN